MITDGGEIPISNNQSQESGNIEKKNIGAPIANQPMPYVSYLRLREIIYDPMRDMKHPTE
jgi:hypothetical protein